MRDDNGKAKTLYIHKLVALAFLPCDDPTRRVVHRDKDRSNNRLENLEWVANVKEKKKALDFVLQEEIVNRIQRFMLLLKRKDFGMCRLTRICLPRSLSKKQLKHTL